MRTSLVLVLAAVACSGGGDASRRASGARDVAAPAPARQVTVLTGLSMPESATYDSAGDAWFVGNVVGSPEEKDGNGFIARVRAADGVVDSMRFIAGGRDGAALDGPRGMAIVGDTLWVADVDALRAFDRRSGRAIASVSLASFGVGFLNDVAAGPDGALYLTDTGKDRVYRIAGRTATIALQHAALTGPNGIAWDAASRHFVLVPFQGRTLMAWAPGDSAPVPIARGAGTFDGVVLPGDGRIIASSWKDSTVSSYTPGDTTAAPTVLVRGVAAVADIGWDSRRRRLALPMMERGRVEVWEVR